MLSDIGSCDVEETPAKRIRRGRDRSKDYKHVQLSPDSFFLPMVPATCKHRLVREHRLVVAQALGRCLQPWEIVHHKNGNKQDNRIENLQLISDLGHRQLTMLEATIARQGALIATLLAENQRLRQAQMATQ